jgi:hypothetical protein
MAMLRVTNPGLARYLDGAGGWDSLNGIFGGGGVTITCEVYPVAPATQVTSSSVTVNGNPRTSSGSATNPRAVTFSVGGDSSENAGDWNTVVVTVMDDGGTQTSFTFFFYKTGGSSTTTTTTTTTSTTTSTTPIIRPVAKPAKGSLKPDKKYAKGKR